MDIYLMNLLSYLYGIIIDCTINSSVHVHNVVDGLNATDKHYLKEQMELLGKSASNDTSNIRMLSSASNNVSIDFEEQCLKIITNNDRLNGLKCRKKYKI